MEATKLRYRERIGVNEQRKLPNRLFNVEESWCKYTGEYGFWGRVSKFLENFFWPSLNLEFTWVQQERCVSYYSIELSVDCSWL